MKESKLSTFLDKTLFFWGGAFALFNKFSVIIYEGTEVKVFGIVTYNTLADRWEIKDPIAVFDDPYNGFNRLLRLV